VTTTHLQSVASVITELKNSDKKIVAAQRFHFVQIFILWIDCAHKCTSGNLAGQRKSLSYLTGLSGCAKFRFFSFRSEKTGIYQKTPEFPEFRAESATKLTCLASLNMLTSSVLSSRVHYLCSIQFTFCYVVGHQDNLMFEDLPLIIHLNVQADTMAKQAICILVGNDTVSILLPLPGKQWAFLANSIPVLQLLLDYLRQLKPLNCHPVLDPERPTLITCSVSHQLGASRSSHNLQLPNLLSVDF